MTQHIRYSRCNGSGEIPFGILLFFLNPFFHKKCPECSGTGNVLPQRTRDVMTLGKAHHLPLRDSSKI